jgi:hypothetical protein
MAEMKLDYFKRRAYEDKEREESKNKLNQAQEEVRKIKFTKIKYTLSLKVRKMKWNDIDEDPGKVK